MTIVTPLQVEARLKDLSKLIDEAHNDLVDSEMLYHASKATYEVSMARSRIELAGKSDAGGRNRTVGEREDLALMANKELHMKVAECEAIVKANRANVARLRVQVDIARSIGTSVRTGMDAS